MSEISYPLEVVQAQANERRRLEKRLAAAEAVVNSVRYRGFVSSQASYMAGRLLGYITASDGVDLGGGGQPLRDAAEVLQKSASVIEELSKALEDIALGRGITMGMTQHDTVAFFQHTAHSALDRTGTWPGRKKE